LLPATDRIAFVERKPDEEPQGAGVCPWSAVEKVCGGLMEKRDITPARVLVRSFPTPTMLAELSGQRT